MHGIRSLMETFHNATTAPATLQSAGLPALCYAADALIPFDAAPYMPAGAPDDIAHMQRGGRAPLQ